MIKSKKEFKKARKDVSDKCGYTMVLALIDKKLHDSWQTYYDKQGIFSQMLSRNLKPLTQRVKKLSQFHRSRSHNHFL